MTRAVGRGTRIGDFVIEALIGTGGMGQVYRAHQIGLDRPVALKVLAPDLAGDPAFVARFRREASMLRDLEHPAVLPVYTAGQDGDLVFLATRLVTGPTLLQTLSVGRMPVPRALGVLYAMAAALDHAHARGIIHRDVKPANVLLDPDGRPFLADFGIAKDIGGANATATGQYLGTPRYMAPEQAADGATISHRADVYSLACVAFEMLAGHAPYREAETVPLLIAHATRPVPRATDSEPSLPPAVDGVFARGMAKAPGDRYPSAGTFVDALAAALSGPAAAPARPGRGWVVGAAVGGAVALALVVALVTALLVRPAVPTPPLAAPSPTPTPVSTPVATTAPPVSEPGLVTAAPAALADVPRGAVLYEAGLNGGPSGFVVSPSTEPDSALEDIRYVTGALELEAYGAGADTYSQLDVINSVTVYLGEMDLSVRPGSNVLLCWSLRWAIPRQLSNYWCVDTLAGTGQFSVYKRGEGRIPIGEPAPLDGLQTGRTVQVALLVREAQLSMYVDGVLVRDVANTEVPVSGTLPGLEMEADNGPGLVRIETLRITALGAA